MIDGAQYLIAKKPYFSDGWRNILLSDNEFYLNWHNDLRACFNKEHSVVLLGDAWSINPKHDSPEKIITGLNSIDAERSIDAEEILLSYEKFWCGRYLLIIGSKIFTDATGMLSCFYSANGISSSVNMLYKLNGEQRKFPKIFKGRAPDFVPGSRTVYGTVQRLLPSQSYDYGDGKLSSRKLLFGEEQSSDPEELTELLLNYFSCSLRNMEKHFHDRKIYLALTGGRDSRTLMSLMEYSGVSYGIFTLEHNNIADADRDIPGLLAQTVGRQNRYIKQKPPSKKRLHDYKVHTAGMAVDYGKLFYASSQYEALKENPNDRILVLRSSVWECVMEYYFKGKLAEPLTMAHLEKIYPLLKVNKDFHKSMQEWLQWVRNDELNTNLCDSNRLLWDIREGCWLAAGEQAFDLMDGICSIQPANCRKIIEILLAYPRAMRLNKSHEELITKRACENLSTVPYDTSYKKRNTRYFDKIFNKIRINATIILYYGLKGWRKVR